MSTKDPSTGELRGVAVDLSRELAARIGVELVQVPYPRPQCVGHGASTRRGAARKLGGTSRLFNRIAQSWVWRRRGGIR